MRTLLLVVVIVGLLAPSAWARDIVLDQKGERPTGLFLTHDGLKAKTGAVLGFEAHIAKLTATDLKTEKGTFTVLSIPGYQHSGIIGAPAVPVMNQIVEVPLGAKLEVTVESSDRRTYRLSELGITAPLMPRQPPQPKSGKPVPFAYEKRTYLAKGFAAEAPVAIEELGMMRARRLVLLKVAPVAYDAASGLLEVRNDMRVRMSLAGADLARTAKMKTAYASPWFDFVNASVLTPASLAALEEPQSCKPSVYAIVADRKFEKDLAPFIAWKTAKGFKVVVGYTDEIGKTTDKIKAYVHGLYNSPAAEVGAPSFVLFVGDQAEIPAFDGQSDSHITDLYYVCATAGDTVPDILMGRFSARNSAELVPQIEKTMEYEKYEFADPSFLKSTTLVAGWDSRFAIEYGWPQINYGAKYYFNAEHGMPASKKFLSAGYSQNEAEIVKRVNDGCSFVNYTAHGSETSWADPSFTEEDINGLKNKGKYPLAVGNCCLTNSFQVETCFGEAWLRAKDKGAIGYIGGSNSTYWDEDLWWGTGSYAVVKPNPEGLPPTSEETKHGAYDGAFLEGACSNGALNLAGLMAVEVSNSPRKLYYWEIYHLMGDPSLCVYWGIPKDSGTQHAAKLAKTATILEVQTAPKACVAVTMDGALLGSGCADAAGKLAVTFKAPGKAGALKVVATGQNLKPYFGSVTVE